ncbi:hypothetical protein [Streptomyces sp. NPDC014734]|uniref:hypothetical protein n=1 Tax=Streptomyces sp. NPDC014734 TaxID=3364886 RepID=UPI0037011FCA
MIRAVRTRHRRGRHHVSDAATRARGARGGWPALKSTRGEDIGFVLKAGFSRRVDAERTAGATSPTPTFHAHAHEHTDTHAHTHERTDTHDDHTNDHRTVASTPHALEVAT